jgi:lysozyme family protein
VIHPFEALRPEYTALLARMRITRGAAVDSVAHKLIRLIDAGHYDIGCKVTGVPVIIAAASFEREAASNFNLNPAQGAPLHQRSTIIPHNGPFVTWTQAQIAAYAIDGMDKVGAANWSWPLACYYMERFNGFGPRNHGRHTGYLWSGSNIYTGGKYIADGVWSASTADQQLGVIPIMKRIVEMRPDLELPHPFPSATDAPTSPPTPAPVPEGHRDAAALQAALNTLGADPQLVVDDNFGRMTRHAVVAFQDANGLVPDGIAGPATWAAIDAKLKR